MELYPVILEHAAVFVGRTPWEVSRDAELLASAHAVAHQFYGHNPVICGIDVYNVEAEAWGAPVEKPDANGVPVLGAPPLREIPELLSLRPLDPQRDGRLPVLLDAARRLPGEVRLALAGPFAIAVGLLGFETVLTALLEEPDAVRAGLQALATHQARLCRQLGVPVTLYESGAAPPLVPPTAFRELIAPALRTVFQAGNVACVMGGDVALVADALVATGPAALICPAETNQPAFLAAAQSVPVRINMNVAFLTGRDQVAARREIDRLATLARQHPRATLGTGVLPYDADPKFVRVAMDYAESLRR
jgi:hypothetical protein